jgi:hypothetical protein
MKTFMVFLLGLFIGTVAQDRPKRIKLSENLVVYDNLQVFKRVQERILGKLYHVWIPSTIKAVYVDKEAMYPKTFVGEMCSSNNLDFSKIIGG